MTLIYESAPDNDGDALGVHTYGNYLGLRDREYLLNVGVTDREGGRAAVLLDRADAEALVEALATHLGWDVIEEMSEEDIARVQHADRAGAPEPEPVYTPREDYQVGDTVIVSDTAYVTQRSGRLGWVSPGFFGKAATVASANAAGYTRGAVEVALSAYSSQYIDVTYLRNISAEFRAADTAAGGTL